MMDIVERLRDLGARFGKCRDQNTVNEAADEIERLREQERKMTNHALERMEEIERLREALKEIDKAIETWFAKRSPIKDALQDFIKEALQQKESE